ncbi:hypothetical protein CCUS01_01449, partial [Colletotrichum cuscutae]
GLKNKVKDKLNKIEILIEFLRYIKLIIKINTRLYKRRKKKGEVRRP